MANKRTLKHTINCVCSGMFAECMLMLRLGNKVDRDNIHALLRAIVVINSDYVGRISHPEPGMSAKTFYKHLTASFNKTILEISDQLSNFN